MLLEHELKNKLNAIRPILTDFNIIYTGKKSKRIDGKYNPKFKEIFINERNCINASNPDNEIILIALHEYAHHIQNTESYMKSNPHDTEFWAIYYSLVNSAEKKGLYNNIFSTEEYKIQFNKCNNAFQKFNKAMEEFFESLHEFAEIDNNKNSNQFLDMAERIFKLPRGEMKKIFKIMHSGISLNGLNYNSILGLSSIKYDFETISNLRVNIQRRKEKDNKYTFDMAKYNIKGNKFKTEKEYLENKEERTKSAIEKGKENLQIIAAKLKDIISGKK